MEATQLISGLGFLVALLIAINSFFLKAFFKKSDLLEKISYDNNTKIDMMMKQMEETRSSFKLMASSLASLDKDLSVLRFAVMNYLKLPSPA